MPRVREDIVSFYQKHRQERYVRPTEEVSTGRQVMDMRLPYLLLDLPLAIPYAEILEEARQVRHLFYEHRSTKNHGHIGWLTLSLFDNDLATTAGKLCPATDEFFRRTCGFDFLYQVRFSLLTPGGMILPHIDSPDNHVKNRDYNFCDDRHINLVLNQPTGVEFFMADAGIVPVYEGCALHLTTDKPHAVWNRSDQERYHVLIHAGASETGHWPETLLRSYRRFTAEMNR